MTKSRKSPNMDNIRTLFDLRDVGVYVPRNLKPATVENKVVSREVIGIEVEVENVNADRSINEVWMVKADGSLRNQGAEFVTRPIEAAYAPDALQYLMQEFLSRDCCFSPRTSVHVHLNMQDFVSEQVVDYLIIYSLFEKALYRFAGRGRMKNIYCVPVTETNLLRYYINEGVGRAAWSKYSGLNLECLRTYGTVEFRHMHGTFDVEKLCAWVNLITSLKEYIRNTPTKEVRSMLFQINDGFDFEALMLKVFGVHARHLKIAGIEDFRQSYMQAKLICLKKTNQLAIQRSLSQDAPFFKGMK